MSAIRDVPIMGMRIIITASDGQQKIAESI